MFFLHIGFFPAGHPADEIILTNFKNELLFKLGVRKGTGFKIRANVDTANKTDRSALSFAAFPLLRVLPDVSGQFLSWTVCCHMGADVHMKNIR